MLAVRYTVVTNRDHIMQCSGHLWFGTQAADSASMTNGRSEAQLKTREGAYAPDRSDVLARGGRYIKNKNK